MAYNSHNLYHHDFNRPGDKGKQPFSHEEATMMCDHSIPQTY